MVVSLTACAGAELPGPSATSSPSADPSATASASESPPPTPSASPSGTTAPSEPPPPPADAPPQQVQGLTTQMGGGSGEVLVRWMQNPEADVVSYLVMRSTTPGGPLTRIGTASRYAVTQFEYVPFVDSQASVAYYRVRAVDAAGQEGPLSIEVCGASVGYSC